MGKKLIIAVDDSRHSKNAVRYAAGIYKVMEDISLTLMHVQPTISQYLLDEAKKSPQAYAALEKVNRKNTETANHLLEKYKEQMMALSIAWNLACVSASSAWGSLSATMPPPATRRADRRSSDSSAQRMATAHVPLPSASTQPTAPP